MIEFCTLGALDLRAGDGRAVRAVLAQPKRVGLLAYLAFGSARGPCRRDTLLAMFWPESTSARARHSLNQALYALRRSLGEDVLVSSAGDAIALNPARLTCDVTRFNAAFDRGDWGAADALYGGELLPGLHVANTPEFERWLDEERLRLRQRAVHAARELAAASRRSGHSIAAVHWLRRATGFAPYDEPIAGELIEALDDLGDRAGALDEYNRFAGRLARDLDVEPGDALRELARRVRAAAVARDPGVPAEATRAEDGSGASVLATPAAVARPGSRRSRHRVAAGVAALLLMVLAGVALRRSLSPVRADTTATRIAVLPFTVRGPDRFGYLGEGMAVLLSATLDGAGALRTVDSRAVLAHLESAGPEPPGPSDGVEIVRRFGADEFVLGSIVAIGGRFQVHAALYDARGRLRSEALSRAGQEAELFSLVDAVARDLVAARYQGSGERLTQLAARTSGSVPALKAYLVGEREFRAGRFAVAADAFGRAAAIDTGFALAHYRRSLASLWADVPDTLPFDADALALRHAARLSEHDRRLITAYGAWRRGAADEAEEIYRGLLALYPDDVEAWHQLGETLFHYNPLRGRALTEARAAFERVVALAPRNWGAHWHLALIAGTEGRNDEFDARTAHLLAMEPDPAQALELRALRSVSRGEALPTDPLRTAHELRLYSIAWRVGVHLRRPAAATEVAALLTTPERTPLARELGHEALVYLELARGRLQRARHEMETLTRINGGGRLSLEVRTLAATLPLAPPDPHELRALRAAVVAWNGPHPEQPLQRAWLLAVVSAAAGDTADALRYANELERLASDRGLHDQYAGHVAGIRARVVWRAGRAGDALRILEAHPVERWLGWAATSPVQSRAADRFLRAELLRELGRDREALAWYASFGEHALHDLAWVGPGLLRRAQIQERLGRRAEAARDYRRFLDTWRDADPSLRPILASARERLRVLQ